MKRTPRRAKRFRLPLIVSEECKRILFYASEEADALQHKHIGTEHLLLGMLRERHCYAAQLLNENDVTLESVRGQIAEKPSEVMAPPPSSSGMPNIKNIVKNNKATFSFYRAGYMFYEVLVDGQAYRFPVNLEDLGTATLLAEHKAITLMRYIRKALEDHTFAKV